MSAQLKQRIIGITILITLGVIVVSILFDHTNTEPTKKKQEKIYHNEPTVNIEISEENQDKMEPPKHIRLTETGIKPPVKEQMKEQTQNHILPKPFKAKSTPIEKKQILQKPKVTKTVEPKKSVQIISYKGKKMISTKEEWMIKLGSFSNKANAEKLVKKLQSNGYHADLKTIKSGKKTINRVIVGPEADKIKANQIQQKLEQLLNIKGVVVKYHI